MNNPLTSWFTLIATALLLSACGSDNNNSNSEPLSSGSGDVRYQIRFEHNWDKARFATGFPANPHFSPLVGATHNQQAVIWRPQDQPATAGLEQVAETGKTSIFTAELNQLKQQGYVDAIFKSTGGVSPGQQNITVALSEQFPLLSAISMIAPSPDWFVGIRDVNLYVDGAWLEHLELDLRLYDAGTESGEAFSIDNPAGGDRIISLLSTTAQHTDFINGVHRDSGLFVGRIVIERQ